MDASNSLCSRRVALVRWADEAIAVQSAARFGLDEDEAANIAQNVLLTIQEQWEQQFLDAGIPAHEISALRGTSVLSPVAVNMSG